MTSAVVVVQARTGSTRLPGKVLADLGGHPMLVFQLARLAHLGVGPVVVATSDQRGDDAVADLAAAAGVGVVRGPEADVLARFALVLDRFPADAVVRLTGDCPLTDPAIVGAVLALHVDAAADYTSNVLPRSFPKGLDVEVVSATALRTAAREAVDRSEREHVVPFVYRRPRRFRLANLDSGDDLGGERWTVDTAEDLDRVRAIVARLDDPAGASWRDVLAIVGRAALPAPGAVHLRPRGSPPAGSSPWRREWAAEVDGRVVGSVAIAVDDLAVAREVDVEAAHAAAAEAALANLLADDEQAAGHPPC